MKFIAYTCFGVLGYYKGRPNFQFNLCSIKEFYKISGWSLLWTTIVVHDIYVIVISQHEWVILVITWVRGEAKDLGNN